MKTMFRYNWMVRDAWYAWCENVPEEELLRERTGGVGGILRTLFHMVDVEWSWIRVMQGEPDFQEDFAEYRSLERVKELDRRFRPEVEAFVDGWHDGLERRPFYDRRADGTVVIDAWGEIMRHVVAHHIHHAGQLSVWAREVGKAPVSPNVIGRGLIAPDL
ncbi:damage-inducible protein DinB [Paenibacillus antri]|uniref:Damage-inducible protein DinB n=1 Tax=Paenibacillus antri TaxID=2582848 RepID=A0A5R9G6M4_9BACL|nr:DinB family protein [Paenibacillus antri]TLS49760.1 damage-inducible protein DinB [Paenibacillus antri]